MNHACRMFVGGLLLSMGAVVLGAAPCDPADIPCLETRIAASPADIGSRRLLAFAWADAAELGSADSWIRSREQLEVVLRASPDDALARARLGRVIVLEALHTAGLSLAERRRLAERGLKELDAAVAAAPDDVAVRLVRARNDAVMPLPLGRAEIVQEDIRLLVATAREQGEKLAPELRRRIFFHAGALALAQRSPESLELLQQAAAVKASSPSEEEVQSMLALAQREFTPHAHAQGQEPATTAAP